MPPKKLSNEKLAALAKAREKKKAKSLQSTETTDDSEGQEEENQQEVGQEERAESQEKDAESQEKDAESQEKDAEGRNKEQSPSNSPLSPSTSSQHKRKSNPLLNVPNQSSELSNCSSSELTASQLYFSSTKDHLQVPTFQSTGNHMNAEDIPVGRRIISNVSLVLNIQTMLSHHQECQQSSIVYRGETLLGLESRIKFTCNHCGTTFQITSNSDHEALSINKGLAWGCLNGPVGYEALASLLTPMDITCISKPSFKKYQDLVEVDIEKAKQKAMEDAVEEEKLLAIKLNNFVYVNGVKLPAIRVVVDGSWAKRSYGHSYDSNYGTAAVIGYKTRNVLDCQVRVKYCFFCTRYKNAMFVPHHKCYKNWNSPSTSMEQDILYECFSTSIEKYGLVYSSFIGDGDSSVYQKVKNVYPGIEVLKIECVNHIIRNLNSKLTAISTNKVKRGVIIPQVERQYPGMEDRFRRVGKAVMSAILHYNEKECHEDYWTDLMDDILNIPDHTFGRHTNCKDYYCKRRGTEPDLVPEVESMASFALLKEAIGRVANHSRSLIEKETSNIVESFMATIAKFLEGKRKNLGGRNLYNLKVAAAVLSFNTTGFWGADAYKLVFGKSPNVIWKKRKNETMKQRLITSIKTRKPRRLTFGFLKAKGDKDYGSHPLTPDLSEIELAKRIDALEKELQVDQRRQHNIEKNTRTQSVNETWFQERRKRITASVAGTIFRLQVQSDNTWTLRIILRTREIKTKALIYGRETEDIAVAKYEQVQNLEPGSVMKCGLFVSLQDGRFAASPDGLIGDDGLLEVKCPYSIRFEDPSQWVKKVGSPLKLVNGRLQLSRKHNYYYQIVVQLFATGRSWCDFFVYTTVGTLTERVFWNDEARQTWDLIKPKLSDFWRNDLAPELVDSRLERGYKDFRCSASREKGRERKNKRKNQSVS